MARVPTKAIAEGQTRGGVTFQGVRASAEDFGAAEGRALSGVGKALQVEGERIAQATDRIARGEEALDRVRLLRSANEQIEAAISAEAEKGSNFETVESVNAVRANIAQIIVGVRGQHKGRPESQLQFAATLAEVEGQAGARVVAAGVTGRNVAIAREVTTNQRMLADAVANGLPLDQAFTQDEFFVNQFADTQTPGQTADAVAAGREAFITAAFNQAFETLDVAGARKVLEKNTKYLPTSVQQTMRNQLVVAETEGARETAKIDARLERVARGLDTTVDKLSKKIVLAANGLGAAIEPQTPQEKLDELQRVRSGMSQDQIDKALGIYIKEDDEKPVFGAGAKGKAFQRLAEQAIDFGNNALTPEEDRLFVAAAMLATQTDELGNRARLGPFVREALNRRDIDLDVFREVSEGVADAFETPEPAPGTAEPKEQAGQPAPGSAEDQEVVPEDQDQAAPQASSPTMRQIISNVNPTLLANGKTFFDLANDFTGLFPALAETAGRVPGLGTILGGGGASTDVRAMMDGVLRPLVDVLLLTVKSPTARVAIEAELSMEPSVFDTPAAYQRRLVGIVDSLNVRAGVIQRALDQKVPLDPKLKRQFLNQRQLIDEFTSIMIPPKIVGESTEEVLKNFEKFNAEVSPGTPFIFLDESGNWERGVTTGPAQQGGEQ